MLVRRARPEDRARLVEGNLAMALETENLKLSSPTLEAGVAAVLADPGRGTYWVLEAEEIIAQLMITQEWSDWRNAWVWWIQSVYVWPQARRQSAYRRLYQQVLAEAKAAGAAGIRLYVDKRNQRAQQTYQNLGMNGDHYQVFEKMFGED